LRPSSWRHSIRRGGSNGARVISITDVFQVTYELDEAAGGTCLTRSIAELGAPRLMHPIYKADIGRDIGKQLKALKELLEN
jgi:hypothetical protein